MTHPIERTVLILLAGTALTACATPTPQYPIQPPVVQAPAPVAPTEPAPQVAAANPQDLAPQAAPAGAAVESSPLEPLPPAAPAASAAVAQADTAPLLAFAPPPVDAAARAKARKPAANEESEDAATYTVRKGDTLEKIADRLGTDIPTLARVNDLQKPYRLMPGQKLKNPAAPAPKASAKASSSSKSAASGSYTVRRGDTLFSIAKAHGTTVEALRDENDLGRSSSLMPGRKLRLPGETSLAEADEPPPPVREKPAAKPQPRAESTLPVVEEQWKEPAGSNTVTTRSVTGRVVEVHAAGKAYKVKKGDTLEKIANRLDSDIEELARLNKLKRPYRLQPGQTIRGPGSSAKAYVVGSGDTLAEISKRFSVSVDDLREENGLRRGASVAPGRKLRLPTGYRDRGPISTTTRVATVTPPAPKPVSPPSSFNNPPPVGQLLPPPRSAADNLPKTPQPYTAPYTPRPSTPSRVYTPGATVAGAPVASPPLTDAQVMQMGQGIFAWPVQGDILQGFGNKGAGQRNDGLNIKAPAGEPIRAAAAGDVVYAGDQVPGFGNLVLIKHADGWVTAYGHLGRVDVRMQQKVTQGQQIGIAGATGGVSETQLHFEVRYAATPQERARPVDPNLVLPR